MNEAIQAMLRVRNWDQLYENNRSRGMKRTSWFPAPNDLSSDRYVGLVSHEHGAAHLGIWVAVLMVASRAIPQRGLLTKDDGQPHTAESLALVTRLPAALVDEALERLLRLRLLEVMEPDTLTASDTPPHPGAANPQEPAAKPQGGAVEGKGREHHHQEGNGKEGKRTTRNRVEKTTEEVSKRSSASVLLRWPDDAEPPNTIYASAEDELKAIYLNKTGEAMSVELLQLIRADLEVRSVTVSEFVTAVKKHTGNRWTNPAGFLRNFSKNFRSKTRSVTDPVTAAEAEERNYKCPSCGSRVRGEGLLLDSGQKAKPCPCASPEYIQRMREKGFLAEAS